MHLPVPAFFRRLDRHLLLNYPVLWILRLHYVLAAWLAGLALIVTVALTLPIRISTVLPFGRPYWLILSSIALLAAPWIYLQAQASRPLRHDPRPWTGIAFLAAYLGLPVIFSLWLSAFYRPFDARIAGELTDADDVTLLRYSQTAQIGPEAELLLQRFGRERTDDIPLTLEIYRRTPTFHRRDHEFLSILIGIKHPTPAAGSNDRAGFVDLH